MNEMELTGIEIAPPSAVRAAARGFAAAVAETAQFQAFELAYDTLRHDEIAQQSLSAYRAKAESLQALLMLNAVSEAERTDLERLKQEYLAHASMQAYTGAEAELTTLCQAAARTISATIGLDYAAACGASCCG